MRTKRRTNQGGSVATFIVVGLILTTLLVGTIYFLKKHGEQVRKDQAIAAYDKQQADKKTTSTSSTKTDSGNETSSDDSSQVLSSPQEMPTTGPELVASELIGASLLTVSMAEYWLSRRNLMRSL